MGLDSVLKTLDLNPDLDPGPWTLTTPTSTPAAEPNHRLYPGGLRASGRASDCTVSTMPPSPARRQLACACSGTWCSSTTSGLPRESDATLTRRVSPLGSSGEREPMKPHVTRRVSPLGSLGEREPMKPHGDGTFYFYEGVQFYMSLDATVHLITVCTLGTGSLAQVSFGAQGTRLQP